MTYLWCFNLTLSARIISFLGLVNQLVISLVVTTVILSDKLANNYDNSRLVALAIGLDWQHYHSATNATQKEEPEGTIIPIIVVVWAFLFMIINSALLFGTFKGTRWCAVLWLVFELLGCISKVGAFIYHIASDYGPINTTFVIGSIIYTVVTVWCCLVVYMAQGTWKYQKKIIFHFEFWNNPLGNLNEDDIEAQNLTIIQSPPPYIPNEGYDVI